MVYLWKLPMLQRFSLFFKNNLLICFYFWLCWVSAAAPAFPVVESGGYSLVVAHRLLLLQRAGSRAWWLQTLQHVVWGWGFWASLLHGTWDLPGSGIEPVSAALAGRFHTAEPPGKPRDFHYKVHLLFIKYLLIIIAFLWDWNENWPFLVLCPLLRFPNCWHIECSTFTVSSFRVKLPTSVGS